MDVKDVLNSKTHDFEKTNPKDDLYDWMVNNFEEVAQDLFSDIAEKHAKEKGWDIVDAHFMAEEMVEKVKEGLLHIIDTCDA